MLCLGSRGEIDFSPSLNQLKERLLLYSDICTTKSQEQDTGVCQMESRGDVKAKDVLTASKCKVPMA